MKLVMYLVFKFLGSLQPHIWKHPEQPLIKKPMKLSSAHQDYSARIKSTWICFMAEYFLFRDQYSSNLCEDLSCKPLRLAEECHLGRNYLQNHHWLWFQPTWRGFNAQMSFKKRVILKDVHYYLHCKSEIATRDYILQNRNRKTECKELFRCILTKCSEWTHAASGPCYGPE